MSRISPSISNGTLLHPNKEFLMNRPNSCFTKSLHGKSCPMYLKVSSLKTIEQCREKIEELEKQNIRLISKVKVLKYQLKTSTSLYNNIHQRPEKPISRLSQRSTPIKQNLSRLSRVEFEENTKTILLPERKFESTESFDSDNSLIDNKSKLRENIEIIHSHRVFKSMQIKLDTLEAQCKSLEQNLLDADELLQKEKDIQEKLTKDLIRERHTLSEIKPKLNSCKETNRALEEQIRDLQKEKSSLKDHNQKLLLLTSKPHNNGLKLKELEDNFTNSRASLLKQMDENNKYIAELITENEHFKNQNLELSQILESKEKEIQQNLKESLEAAEKYKINNDLSRINDNQTALDQPNIDTDDKRLKSQIEDLQQAQAKINQALVSQSYLNNKMKDKVEKLKNDLKIATELLKNLSSLFTGIISLDLIWPIITTTEVVEKAINVLKKNADININNIDLEDVIKKVMDILNDFRDKIIKKHTVFNQEQLFLTTSNLNQNHLSNHLIDEQIHFSNATQNNIPQFEVHMQNLTFSDESLLYLKSIQSEPNIFLAWGFKDQEDMAYSPSKLAWSADFNCSCFYRSSCITELLHFITKHGLFVNIHLAKNQKSPRIATGLLNTFDSLNNPMEKLNLIVPIKGENVDAKLKCTLQLACNLQDLLMYKNCINNKYNE